MGEVGTNGGWRRGQEPLGGASRAQGRQQVATYLPRCSFRTLSRGVSPWSLPPSMPNLNPHPALHEPCSQLAALWGEAPRMESTSFHLKPQTHPLDSV